MAEIKKKDTLTATKKSVLLSNPHTLTTSIEDLQDELRLMDTSETEEERKLRQYHESIEDKSQDPIEFTAVTQVLPDKTIGSKSNNTATNKTLTMANLKRPAPTKTMDNLSMKIEFEKTRQLNAQVLKEDTASTDTGILTEQSLPTLTTKSSPLTKEALSDLDLVKIKAEIMVEVVSDAKLLEYKINRQLDKIKTTNTELQKCISKIKSFLKENSEKKIF